MFQPFDWNIFPYNFRELEKLIYLLFQGGLTVGAVSDADERLGVA